MQYTTCSKPPPLFYSCYSAYSPSTAHKCSCFTCYPCCCVSVFFLRQELAPTPNLTADFLLLCPPSLCLTRTLRPFSRFALLRSFLAAAQNFVVKDVIVQPTSSCYTKRTNAAAARSRRSLNVQNLSTLLLVGAAA